MQKMPHYWPQVDEPASFADGPPPAYPRSGCQRMVELVRLLAGTGVCVVALVGAFVLLAACLHSTASCSCSTEEFASRFDAGPSDDRLIKLRIGENLKDHKGKSHLDCLVERREQILDAMPPQGEQRLQVKGEQTIISCSSGKGKKGERVRRSPVCDCSCAC